MAETPEAQAGGLIAGPAGEDTVPVLLRPGEHIYGPDGKLLLVVAEQPAAPEKRDQLWEAETRMSVQAKVRCIANSPPQWDSAGNSRLARFTPVYDSDPSSPNFEWSQATPSGYIELAITNEAAFARFEPGREYLLTFDPA